MELVGRTLMPSWTMVQPSWLHLLPWAHVAQFYSRRMRIDSIRSRAQSVANCPISAEKLEVVTCDGEAATRNFQCTDVTFHAFAGKTISMCHTCSRRVRPEETSVLTRQCCFPIASSSTDEFARPCDDTLRGGIIEHHQKKQKDDVRTRLTSIPIANSGKNQR